MNNACTLVTQEAPDFTAEAVLPDNTFGQIKLSSYRGKYVVLFFYPLDFTFVCPSEILAFNKKLEEFKAKNCEVIGVSVDSKFTHLAWKNTTVDNGGIGNIQYPLVQDLDKSIARSYGILFNESVALRGLFLIDTRGDHQAHGHQRPPPGPERQRSAAHGRRASVRGNPRRPGLPCQLAGRGRGDEADCRRGGEAISPSMPSKGNGSAI